VDDDNGGGPWIDADLTLQFLGGKDVDGHGCPPRIPIHFPRRLLTAGTTVSISASRPAPRHVPNGSREPFRGRRILVGWTRRCAPRAWPAAPVGLVGGLRLLDGRRAPRLPTPHELLVERDALLAERAALGGVGREVAA